MVDRPTVSDLAREAGVSVATVDRVLNRRLPVREDTALRVIRAAERIGYHATGLLKQRLREVPPLTLGFLLQKRDYFYQGLGAELAEATRAAHAVDGRAIVEYNEELVPATIAARARDLATRCDALGMVAVDHPVVNEAVAAIAAEGKPVFALLSDISAPERAGCFSADRRKSGRIAAWAISRLAPRPGKIGMLIGSHRYLSQETAEISFRSYMRENAPDFTLLEPIIYLDDPQIAHAAVIELLSANPDLVGLVNNGGGVSGLVSALREERGDRQIVTVCNELTPITRAALVDGFIDVVLDTPSRRLAEAAVDAMIKRVAEPSGGLIEILLPPDLHISETA